MRGRRRVRKRTIEFANLYTGTSKKAIEDFVTKLLESEEINMQFVPDSIEHKIYTTVLYSLVESLRKVLDNLTIDFIGHRIKLNMAPINPTI